MTKKHSGTKKVPLWPALIIPLALVVVKPELTAIGILIALFVMWYVKKHNKAKEASKND